MNDEDRILDLLTERLERTLTAPERAELDALLKKHPRWRRSDLDFAAAAIHMALEPGLEPMPEELKARVIGQLVGDATRPALRLAADADSPVPGSGGSLRPQAQARTQPDPRTRRPRGPRDARSPVVVIPWLAAAAALVFAVVGWWPRVAPGDPRTQIAEARTRLAQDPSAVVVAWSQTEDPLGKGVRGDVVWDPKSQTGFMRFEGLPANDPKISQYQLWIFDAARDERYPVDGGVFDIDASGATVVAIQARVPVKQATLFAVTLEKPGGVVVSTRERLVALGKVG